MLANRTGNKLLALLLLIPLAITGIVLGIFFFAVALAMVSVFVAVLFLRLWWVQRKLRKSSPGSIIEGDFQVISPKHRLRRPGRTP